MRAAENERLCRIGPGTPMGAVVRQFWTPGCLSSDLPSPGGAPIRVSLFGEDLVAFRGADGKVGVLDEYCPHRGSSLALARNEDCALRCIFHGWKIGRDGAILEMPNADNDRALKRYRARSFLVEESHGVIWVFMGDAAKAPPRPRYAWENVPEENCLIIPVDLDCNWVQSLEGLVDTAHTGVLHEDVLRHLPPDINPDVGSLQFSKAPKLEIEKTDFGFHYAAIRATEDEDVTRVRVTSYIAPFLCLIPPTGQAFMTVPLSDVRTRFYSIWWSDKEQLSSGKGRETRVNLWGLTEEILRATGMTAVNPLAGEVPPRNRFDQDRRSMESGESFSGLPGLTAEDAAVAVMMGPIAKRDNEHLVAADAAVVQMRYLLLDGATAVEEGKSPSFAGGATPSEQIDAISATVSNGRNWRELVPAHIAIPD